MQKGHYSMFVTDIQHAYKQRGSNNIHLISFIDIDEKPYQAEEMERELKSRFVVNQVNNFELTHPGKNGYLDWIRFTSVANSVTGVPAPKPTTLQRDDIMIATTAFNAAVNLGLKHKWPNEKIIDEAFNFASNIKLIARQVSEEFI